MAINALTQLPQERLTFALDVDRESRVPLYEQLHRQFRQAIQDGRLDPSWARIVNGLLLFAFIALQKLLTQLRLGGKRPISGFPIMQAS